MHKFNFVVVVVVVVVVYECENLLFALRGRTGCEGRQEQIAKLDGWA